MPSIDEQLIKRLEVAVSKLEEIASFPTLKRSSSVVFEGRRSNSGSASSSCLPSWIEEDFSARILREQVPLLIKFAEATGKQEMVSASQVFEKAMEELEKILIVSSLAKKPNKEELTELLKPLFAINSQLKSDNRSEFYQNVKAVSEALVVCLAVTNSSPSAHVEAVIEAVDFHANKVLIKKNPQETEWIRSLKLILKSLFDLLKEHWSTGVIWNVSSTKTCLEIYANVQHFNQQKRLSISSPSNSGSPGSSPASRKSITSSMGPKKVASPPPLPKSLPPPPPPLVKEPGTPSGKGISALMKELIVSGGTSTLKKVTDDMKVKHHSPRTSADNDAMVSMVGSSEGSGVRTSLKESESPDRKKPHLSVLVTGKPPVFELKRESWFLENFFNEKVDFNDSGNELTMKQMVYVGNSQGCVFYIQNKCKSIMIDSCKKTNIVLNSVISSVELVNCEKCQIQVTGALPTLSIDKSSGISVYLSKEAMNVVISTSKSSEMNVSFPSSEDGEYHEIPIPEQYVHKFDLSKNHELTDKPRLSTTVSGLYA